jgi:hypothetical protein
MRQHSILILLCLIMQNNAVEFSYAASVGTCLQIANVERWDFLYIRAKPHHESMKVGAIAPNTDSPIVISGKCTPNTKNLRRLWCLIDYYVTNETTHKGYIKMYFTRKIMCPPSLAHYRRNKN